MKNNLQTSSQNSVITLPTQQPILRLKTLPNDANKGGDIFGGWLMSQVDIAGAMLAAKRAQGPVVTVAVKQLTFLKPVFVYDLVSFYGEVTGVGKTSITVEICAYAQRVLSEEVVKVSDAILIYVAVSKPGEKRLVPPLSSSAP